jgi:hypothetical protein
MKYAVEMSSDVMVMHTNILEDRLSHPEETGRQHGDHISLLIFFSKFGKVW